MTISCSNRPSTMAVLFAGVTSIFERNPELISSTTASPAPPESINGFIIMMPATTNWM